jgi:hypothetical protein
MSSTSSPTGPDLHTLLGLFPPADEVFEHEFVPGDEVPPPYNQLLVHEHHMTVTVEAYHGDLVNVRILNRRHKGDVYARKILLTLQGSGKVVQFGVARIHLNFCTPAVREEIIAGKKPLGRILIEHDVLRRIEPKAFLRVLPGPSLVKNFGLIRPVPTFGRLGIIHCDDFPAVEVLEIVIPAVAFHK